MKGGGGKRIRNDIFSAEYGGRLEAHEGVKTVMQEKSRTRECSKEKEGKGKREKGKGNFTFQ